MCKISVDTILKANREMIRSKKRLASPMHPNGDFVVEVKVHGRTYSKTITQVELRENYKYAVDSTRNFTTKSV